MRFRWETLRGSGVPDGDESFMKHHDHAPTSSHSRSMLRKISENFDNSGPGS